MFKIGNLAIICAERSDVKLRIMSGKVTVIVGHGIKRQQFSMDWQDDTAIDKLIYQLNHGTLRKEATA